MWQALTAKARNPSSSQEQSPCVPNWSWLWPEVEHHWFRRRSVYDSMSTTTSQSAKDKHGKLKMSDAVVWWTVKTVVLYREVKKIICPGARCYVMSLNTRSGRSSSNFLQPVNFQIAMISSDLYLAVSIMGTRSFSRLSKGPRLSYLQNDWTNKALSARLSIGSLSNSQTASGNSCDCAAEPKTQANSQNCTLC